MTDTELKYYEIKKFLLNVVKLYNNKENEWERGYSACAKVILAKMNPKAEMLDAVASFQQDEYVMTEEEAEALRDTSKRNSPKIPIRQRNILSDWKPCGGSNE